VAENLALPATAFEQARLALNTALRFDPESARTSTPTAGIATARRSSQQREAATYVAALLNAHRLLPRRQPPESLLSRNAPVQCYTEASDQAESSSAEGMNVE